MMDHVLTVRDFVYPMLGVLGILAICTLVVWIISIYAKGFRN